MSDTGLGGTQMGDQRAANSVCSLPRAPRACPGRVFILRKSGKPDLRRGRGGEGVSVCTFLQCCWISWAFDAATSVVNDDHLSSSLVRLHDAVSFTDFIEAEDPGRLDVQPTRSLLRSVEEGRPRAGSLGFRRQNCQKT